MTNNLQYQSTPQKQSSHPITNKKFYNETFQALIAGASGGILNVAVGYPFDTIKVRIQTKPKIYGGALNALKLTVKNSPLSLYRGVGAIVPGVGPCIALMFTGHEHGKLIFGNDSPIQYFLAGSFSALYTTPIVGPGERVKCVAQTTKKYGKGAYRAFIGLYQTGGMKSILKGTGWTLGRDLYGLGVYFGVYEYLKQTYMKRNNCSEFPITANILCGGLTGMAEWCCIMPIDVIKTRIQTAPTSVSNKKVRLRIRKEARKRGFKVYYKGLNVVLMRAIPANGATFLGYEQCRKYLLQ